MRIAYGAVLATVVALVAGAAPGHVVAKTYIELTPDFGPTGSIVEVAGFGFASGEIRIALAPLDAVEAGFHDALPDREMVALADAVAVSGDVRATVVLPGAQAFPWGKQVVILAIQEDPTTSGSKFFVAKATFTVTALRDLPASGHGPGGGDSGLGNWLAPALALGGALIAWTGLWWRRIGRR